jgi:hypothetical protein
MYDFQFITYKAGSLNEALAGVRGLFKFAFPRAVGIRVVESQVLQEVTPGKLHGQFNISWTVILTIDSEKELVAESLPPADAPGMKIVN